MPLFLSARRVSSSSLELSSTSKMMWSVIGLHALSEGEEERGAAAHLGFRPDAPAVARDDTLDRGQPDPGAFELTRAVEALKYSEQLRGKLHVETSAIVP